MSTYSITAYCYEHGGEMSFDTRDEKEAFREFDNIRTIARDVLGVSDDSSAMVIMSKDHDVIKRERV
jgi:hypothetical protein